MFTPLKKLCSNRQLLILPNKNILNLTKFKFGSSSNNDKEYHKFKFDRQSYNQELNNETREK